MISYNIQEQVDMAGLEMDLNKLMNAFQLLKASNTGKTYSKNQRNLDAEYIIDGCIKLRNEFSKETSFVQSGNYSKFYGLINKITIYMFQNSDINIENKYGSLRNYTLFIVSEYITRNIFEKTFDTQARKTIEEILDKILNLSGNEKKLENCEKSKNNYLKAYEAQKINYENEKNINDKQQIKINSLSKLIGKLENELDIEKEKNLKESKFNLAFINKLKLFENRNNELNIEKENLKNQIENLQNDFDNSKNQLTSQLKIQESIKTKNENLISKLKNKDIEINDINLVESFGDSGLFYKIEDPINLGNDCFYKVSIHIIDTENKNLNNIEELHKYHIFECHTIREMKSRGRKFRYSVSSKKDNTFVYKNFNSKGVLIEQNENQELLICQHCLDIYNQINSRNSIKGVNKSIFNNNHLLRRFLENEIVEKIVFPFEYVKDFESIPNQYTKDWDEVSTKIKTRANYICSECNWHPKKDYEKRFINTHHINYTKFDNKEENLRVLCIACHSKVDKFHNRITKSNNFKEFLKIK